MTENRDATPQTLEDLALRLLDPNSPTRAPGQGPRLFVGRLPPDLPVAFPVPEGSQVLGSYVDSRQSVTVLLEAPLPREAAFDYYLQRLSGMGWTRIEQHPRLGFFDGPRQRPPDLHNGGTYCQSAHGPAITVRADTWTDRSTSIRLGVLGPLQNPCAGPGDPPGSDPLMPILAPPPETELLPRFRAGGGDFSRVEAQLITNLDMTSVASHYERQLEQAGWTRRFGEEHGYYAWSTWVYRAEDMPDRQGILFFALWQHPGLASRGGAAGVTERPEIVPQFWLELRTAWKPT
jgi:hypothetical protein